MSPKALALPPDLMGEGRGVGEGQEAEGTPNCGPKTQPSLGMGRSRRWQGWGCEGSGWAGVIHDVGVGAEGPEAASRVSLSPVSTLETGD